MTTSTILDCGHEPSVHSGFSTGFGKDSDGKTFCYECAADLDREQMETDGKTTLYLCDGDAPRKYKVTNWPGSLSFNVGYSKQGRHNMAGTRVDVWFMVGDRQWHGTQYGENTQLVHCKRLAN